MNEIKAEKIIVTGGCGFIGSSFVRKAVEIGHKVLIIDKLTYASDVNSISALLNDNLVQLIREDICNSAAVSSILLDFKPDKIVHFAAESHVDNSISNPENFIQTNVVGTYSLLQATNKLKQISVEDYQRLKFHHISTDEVYGDLPNPFFVDSGLGCDVKFTEQTPYQPSSPYSASKAASDHLVRSWNRTYGLHTTISNCSNNFGPFQHAEKLIPKTIISAINLSPISIYGNGLNIRDWLYVDDHVDAIFKILQEGQVGETYNIGAENELTNIDVVNKICDSLEDLYPVKNNPSNSGQISSYKELLNFVDDRPGHDTRYAIDPTKLKTHLGWSPKVDFTDGLIETINHYLYLSINRK